MNERTVATDPRGAAPECVPARMLNEFVYCPRLAYLEWVQGEFADSADTLEGAFHHRRVNDPKGDVPEPSSASRMDYKADHQGVSYDHIHARSVRLSAPKLGLTAVIDVLEADLDRSNDGKLSVTPVDYKRGAVPNVPEKAWEPERIQLCAQGLILRENGYRCDSGVIYFAASRTRVRIKFDEALCNRVQDLLAKIRQMAESGKAPPPLGDSPKCVRCSLAGICLPDEVNLLAGRHRPTSRAEEVVRRLVPARDDALPLYVQEQGAVIRRCGEVFEIHNKGTKLGEAKIFETSQVCIFGNVQVSTQALREMCLRNIPVVFFSTGGWFYGLAHGMSHKNVELRRAQFRTADDPAECLALASSMVAAKIENCRTLLMRNHTNPPKKLIDDLAQMAIDARSARSIESLLGIEGIAGKAYFSAFCGMLKPRDTTEPEQWDFDFAGRNRRPPLDPINAMLSYAYSLLVKDLSVTALAVGLDPFMGLYHKPRYGRPALALDLMEEFRPIIADSVVLWTINNGVLRPCDFIRRGAAATFKPAARAKFIKAYERRLDSLVTHPVFGYRISYRRVLEVQVRLLGRVLLGELKQYPNFTTR